MPSLAVSTAFEARLADWAHITVCPFVDLNEVSEVPSPPFIEIEYPVSDEERLSLGDDALFRETGGARFVITVKAFEQGWKAAVLEWAEELRDLFRMFEFGPGDGEVLEVSPAVLDDANRDGNRYRVPFVATYWYDCERTRPVADTGGGGGADENVLQLDGQNLQLGGEDLTLGE